MAQTEIRGSFWLTRLTALVGALLAIFFLFDLSSCSSVPESEPKGAVTSGGSEEAVKETPKNYENILDRWTRNEKKYAGLENKFEITATLLATEVLNSQLAMDNQQYKWSQQDYAVKRNKQAADAENTTKVFASFFTPVEENNNLDKAASVWNVFLVTPSGEHIPAKSIKRVFGNMADLKLKYPYHNPWSKPYEMTFTAPTGRISETGAKLVITGPVGTAELKF